MPPRSDPTYCGSCCMELSPRNDCEEQGKKYGPHKRRPHSFHSPRSPTTGVLTLKVPCTGSRQRAVEGRVIPHPEFCSRFINMASLFAFPNFVSENTSHMSRLKI